MTREEAKHLLSVIQAFAEGRAIECRTKPGIISNIVPNKWTEMKEIGFWNGIEYRIKPEPKYRPFKNAEECWQEMLKHQPFGWIMDEDSYHSIAICDDKSIEVPLFVNNDSLISFKEAMDGYTFADGTPFGVKEEE